MTIGSVSGPHGLDGAFKVFLLNPLLAQFLKQLQTLFLPDGSHTILKVQITPKGPIIRLEGTTLAYAQQLKGTPLTTAYDTVLAWNSSFYEVPELLLEATVHDDGKELGIVSHIEYALCHPILSIQPIEGPEILLPLVPSFVKSLDTENHRLNVVEPVYG